MRNLFYAVIVMSSLVACDNSDDSIAVPTDVVSISAEPRIGGALVKWSVPADGDYTYLEIKYLKNGKEVVEKASKYTDTLLITGLINKEEFSFDIQSVNETPSKKQYGNFITSNKVRPIERSSEITYYPDQLEKILVTADMIDTYTQETSEGPKENLVDGNPGTYWHSAWSGNVAPLPHWIQINFDEPTDMGAIAYWFRDPSSDSGRPSQWGLEVSEDGEEWERVWTSKDNLSIADPANAHNLPFDKNYTSKYFRAMILKNGSMSFAHLGEIEFFRMNSKVVDKEKEAEEIYYNF